VANVGIFVSNKNKILPLVLIGENVLAKKFMRM